LCAPHAGDHPTPLGIYSSAYTNYEVLEGKAVLKVALFLYIWFMVFELLMFAVIAITFFLSMIAVLLAGGDKEDLTSFIVSVLVLWVLGNGLAFLVYLGVSALH